MWERINNKHYTTSNKLNIQTQYILPSKYGQSDL